MLATGKLRALRGLPKHFLSDSGRLFGPGGWLKKREAYTLRSGKRAKHYTTRRLQQMAYGSVYVGEWGEPISYSLDAICHADMPCIYLYEDAKGHPLYIGASKCGVRRAYQHGQSERKQQPHRYAAFLKAARITVFPFLTASGAFDAECEMIRQYNPPGNRTKRG